MQFTKDTFSTTNDGGSVAGRPSLFRMLLLAALLWGAGGCRLDEWRPRETWTELDRGIAYLERVTAQPLRVHALVVDLCDSGVVARATAPDEGPMTVSGFGELVEAEVVVNGDFFDENYRPLGLAVGDGRRWPGTRERPTHGLLAFGPGRAWLALPGETVGQSPSQAIGGRPVLVRGGDVVAPTAGVLCANRHPRTAVGISEDGRRLIVAVVDGRSRRSAGMNCIEMARLMLELGSHDALNLDGGGSSSMWLRSKGVVNRPSEGSERRVANHLGLKAPTEERPSHCPSGDPPEADPLARKRE